MHKIQHDFEDKKPVRPFLRWAGSKRQTLSKLQPFWNKEYRRYVEPFMGSACLFYSVVPDKAMLSDLNRSLIETYWAVCGAPLEVYERVMAIPRGKESYYQIRAQASIPLSPVERAARFIFLNRFCFNGLYRTNSSGQFNVPYANSGTGEIPSWREFDRAVSVLSNAEIECCDYQKTLLKCREGDFVYLDPPYAVSGTRIFTEYNANCFTVRDLQKLSQILHTLEAKGAHFLLSYADCPEAHNFFDGWNFYRVEARRSIAGSPRFRRRDIELLISNKVIDTTAIQGIEE